MSTKEQRLSDPDRSPFDDSIFKPRTDRRVQVPSGDGVVYEEEQTFDQLWLWALMGFELVSI